MVFFNLHLHPKIITMEKKMEKHCAGCKEHFSAERFYKNKTNEDGLSIYCKECTKMNAKKYYQKKLIKEANKENILRKIGKIKKTKKSISASGIEDSLKLAMIEKHLMLCVNLLQEYKQEKELFTGTKTKLSV